MNDHMRELAAKGSEAYREAKQDAEKWKAEACGQRDANTALRRERDEARAEVERLTLESIRMIEMRDHREEQIGNILREMGSDAEWTSMCDLGDHGIEVAAALVGERDNLRKSLEAVIERVNDGLRIIVGPDPMEAAVATNRRLLGLPPQCRLCGHADESDAPANSEGTNQND